MEIKTYQVTPLAVNCYIVKDGEEALLIDPGDFTTSVLKGLEGLKVRLIVNTHGHADHCAGNAEAVKVTGAELAAHEADLPLINIVELQGQMFGIPFQASPEPTRLLKDGDTVSVGSVTFTVRHVPGHSPGHIALIGNGVTFVGDVLFSGSIGRTDFPGCSHAVLMESIKNNLLTLPDDTIVYPGHGPATTIGRERNYNPFLGDL